MSPKQKRMGNMHRTTQCKNCGKFFKRLASHMCPRNPPMLSKHFGPIPPSSEKLQQALKDSLALEEQSAPIQTQPQVEMVPRSYQIHLEKEIRDLYVRLEAKDKLLEQYRRALEAMSSVVLAETLR